jgi:hypothetical protein
MKDFTNSKILGKSNCQGHNQSWMRKVKCIKVVTRFTFLWLLSLYLSLSISLQLWQLITQWLSIDLYVVQKWKSIPILLLFWDSRYFATFDIEVHDWIWGLMVGGMGKKIVRLGRLSFLLWKCGTCYRNHAYSSTSCFHHLVLISWMP